MNGKVRSDLGQLRRHERHRQTLAYRVTIAAGRDETDAMFSTPDRFVARRIRINCIHFKRDRLMGWPRPGALGRRLFTAYEIAFVPSDPAVHAGHTWRVPLSE